MNTTFNRTYTLGSIEMPCGYQWVGLPFSVRKYSMENCF